MPAGQSVREMVRQVFTGKTPPSAADLAAGVIAGQADAVAGAAGGCDVLVAAGLTTAVAGTVRADGATVAAKMLLDAVAG